MASPVTGASLLKENRMEVCTCCSNTYHTEENKQDNGICAKCWESWDWFDKTKEVGENESKQNLQRQR